MANSNIIRGDELMLFDENNQALLYATSHVLTITGNTTDINTKDHGAWGASNVGKITWELQAECLFTSNDYDALFDQMISGEKIFIKWGKAKNYDVNGLESCGGSVQKWIPADVVKQGYAYITSLVANANTGENATFSITYTGAGALKESSASETDYVIELLYSGNFAAGTPIKLYNPSNDVAGYKITDATNNISAEMHTSDENTYTPTLATTAVNVELYIEKRTVPSKLFQNITALTTIIIGDTTGATENDINKLGSYLCAGCTGLTTVSLNAQITSIPTHAFHGCTNLDELWMYVIQEDPDTHELSGMPAPGQYAFNGVSEQLELYVPDELISWYESTTPWSNLTVNAIS